MNSIFCILFADIVNLTIEELKQQIISTSKKVIGDLRLIDLIFEKKSMTGIYIIFDDKDLPVYVGKTGSRAILERLAGHFDLRPGAYMNSFLCALAGKRKQRKGPHATEEDLRNVYDQALNHKLLFIQIPNTEEHKKKITKLESILSKELNTKFNTRRGAKAVNVKTVISEL